MQRNIKIDMIKGLGVITILCIHLWSNAYDNLYIRNVFAVTLALFFVVSGYFLKYEKGSKAIFKRLKKIFIPFIKFFLSTFIIGYIIIVIQEGLNISEISRSFLSELLGQAFLDWFFPGVYLKTEIHRPLTVSWFFIQLLIATFNALFIIKICKKNYTRIGIVSLMLLVISALCYTLPRHLPLEFQMTLAVVAYMLWGYILNKKNIYQKLDSLSDLRKICILSLGLAIQLILYSWNQGTSQVSHGYLGKSGGPIDVVTGTIQVVLASFWIYILCFYMEKISFLKKALSHFGKNSFDYVSIHLMVAWIPWRFWGVPIAIDYIKTDSFRGSVAEYLAFLGLMIIDILICTLIIKLKNSIINRKKPI